MKKRSFGKIQQMRSGRYQASYIDSAGTRRYAPDTFSTKQAAASWLSDIRAKLNTNSLIDLETAAKTFEEYAIDWLVDKKETVRPKTALLYAGIIDEHLTPFLGAYPLKDITPNVVKKWRRWMLQRFEQRRDLGDIPRKDTTGKTRTAQAYRLLHAIMATAYRDQAISLNPCNIVGASSSDTAERKPATIRQIGVIADNMPERYSALIHVAAWSGLRFSELAGLTRADVVLVRLEDGENAYRLNVDKQTYRINGKLYEKEPTKTRAGRRVVFLPPHVTPILTEHMEKYTGTTNDAYVFTTGRGTPINSNSLGKAFREARKAAGRDDLRFHDLRHTCATFAAQTGATTKELMNLMGHSSPRAALIYQHATEERTRQIAANMSRLAEHAQTREQVRQGLKVIEGGAAQEHKSAARGRVAA
ncbi:tyrosine-type recombinase/integrase [Bifidobacterium olomucense]|uniref:Integrase n=1 Tax=Bifidobacterium olomucense TaxID=2675324 RepID=A0A7Y0EYS8_9BIFI|nr:site-specific integrase [Bifidobacterium sp. DSM 109959]NMM98873.1 integrase [Bifidobacterium sp. DSM 109959]